MKTINLTWQPTNFNEYGDYQLPTVLPSKNKYNIHIFVPNIPANFASMPTVWTWLKTYYEKNGNYTNKFNWVHPQYFQNHDIEKIWSHLEQNPPDIFGFGGYIWNISLCYEICQRVKTRWPHCLIIAGGPQPEYKTTADYFANHSYIDIVVPFDGEVPFTEILDIVGQGGNNFESVSDIVLPTTSTKGFLKSTKHTDRKSFVWPGDPFVAQEEMLEQWMAEARAEGGTLAAMVETVRGCPYKCTFCDWGGGTYTKIRIKPIEQVHSEINWIIDHKIDTFRLLDANFGILPRDVEIAKYIADLKIKTGYPKDFIWYPAKQNKDRVVEIYKHLHRAGLVYDYNISMQSISEDIKDNIRRTDFGWEESMEIAREMKAIGLESTLRVLLGVPGQTWQNFLTDIDEILKQGINYPVYDPWMMLPNSPGADPEYIKEHDIKLIERAYEVNIGVALKPTVPYDKNKFGGFSLGFQPDNSTAWYVIGTSSYTIDEWIDMYCMNCMMIGMSRTGVTRFVSQYLNQMHGVNYSEFYHDLYKNFLRDPALCGDNLYSVLNDHLTTITTWVYNDEKKHSGPEVSVDILPNFPFVLSPENYWTFLGLVYSNELCSRLESYLLKKYNDPRLSEVIAYNYMRILTPDYNPDIGKQHQFSYNWHDYLEGNSELKLEPNIIIVSDQNIGTGSLKHSFKRPIKWHTEIDPDEKLLQFFYHTSVNVRTSRLANNFEIIKTSSAKTTCKSQKILYN